MITDAVAISSKVGQRYIIRYNKPAHLISLRCSRPTGRMCVVCVVVVTTQRTISQ
jgi:hypothetical protein